MFVDGRAFTVMRLYNPLEVAYYRVCSDVSGISAAAAIGCVGLSDIIVITIVSIITNGLYYGVLSGSKEAQRVVLLNLQL